MCFPLIEKSPPSPSLDLVLKTSSSVTWCILSCIPSWKFLHGENNFFSTPALGRLLRLNLFVCLFVCFFLYDGFSLKPFAITWLFVSWELERERKWRHLFNSLKFEFGRTATNFWQLTSDICSDEGLRLQTSALETLYGGQFTLSIRVIKPNYLVTSGSTNATAKIHWVHGKEEKSIF